MFTPDHCQFERSRGEVLRVNTARTVDEHGMKFVLGLSSTNTERPPEDVPCLPQTAASMKGLGTHTVCKPEPESKNEHISSCFVLFLYNNYA